MKTVAELSREIGVSIPTIYRKINTVKQNTKECLTEKSNGITYITEIGEQLIKEAIKPVNQKNNNVNQMLNSDNQVGNDTLSYLLEQNKILQEELLKEREHNREQANEIIDLAKQLVELTRNGQELTRNSQVLHAKYVPQLPSNESDTEHDTASPLPSKKSFFSRIFKSK